MQFSEEVKAIIQKAPYITLVTMNEDGTPHPIIVGGKKQQDDVVIVGIYKMDATRKNLAVNSRAWLLAATLEGGPKGFRLEGTAKADEKAVIFTPEQIEPLI